MYKTLARYFSKRQNVVRFIILFSLPEFEVENICDSAVVRWESLEDRGPGVDFRTRLIGPELSKKVFIQLFIALGSNFRRITLEEIPNPHKNLPNLIHY